jgi:hypothetical protein
MLRLLRAERAFDNDPDEIDMKSDEFGVAGACSTTIQID